MSRAILIMAALRAENRRRCILSTNRRRRNLRSELLRAAMELSEAEFRAHYRFTKQMFVNLCNELRPYFTGPRRKTKISVECKILVALSFYATGSYQKPVGMSYLHGLSQASVSNAIKEVTKALNNITILRKTKISVECKILVALSFYATGSYQKPVGMSYLHGLSQASVSNAIKEVTKALNNITILRKYIRFPQSQVERNSIIHGFFTKFAIPGVLGCIDGTHVALVKPIHHEERFFNRKHYFSRNVQIICDSDLNILNVDASFGGAAHDAFVWRQSELHSYMQQLYLNGENVWFLGDSGYPLRPWLLTPIPNAVVGTEEEHYTKIHCLARNSVERCIGVLKARWRCLLSHRILHYNHHIVADIVNACCVLHNIANRHQLPVTELSTEEAQRDMALQVFQEIPETLPAEEELLEEGIEQQQHMVERLWSDRLQ